MTLFLVNAAAVGLFFKPILDEFQLDRATLSGVFTIAQLLFAIVTLFLGRLIDRFGPRSVFFICLGTQTLSSTIYGLAGSLWHLFSARLLYEIKAAQANQVLINRWFVKKRGQAQGIAATGMPIGALALSPLSQYMVLAWGWRETMFFWAGISFIILLPLALLVRNNPAEKGSLPDGEPLDTANDVSFNTKEERYSISAAGVSGYTLAEAARMASFWLLGATQLICGIGCGFMMTHIVIFTTDMGYSAMIGASLLSVQGGVNLAGVLVTGHISDKYARNRVLALTHAVRSLAFITVVIFILGNGGSLWVLYRAVVMFGFGWFTTSPLSSGLAADLFGGRSMGIIIGVLMSCHTVGTAIGVYGGGLTYDIAGSYFWFFVIQAGLEIAAAGCAWLIKQG
jgi:MFS family permease